MNKIPFKIERQSFMGVHDAAYVVNEQPTTDDLQDELVEAVLQSIGTDLEITIGGTTMFLSAWRDLDHWEEDWARALGCDPDEVGERVEGILKSALVAT